MAEGDPKIGQTDSWRGDLISISTKGQLISKCLFGVIVWTKNQRKNYQDFCFSLYRTEILVIFTLVFCPNDDTKKTF